MKIEVIVFKRPNMFKVNDNLFHRIGTGELKNLFTIEDYKVRKNSMLTLFYPERFLNIIEQRILLRRAEAAGFSKISIATSSAFILQTCDSSNISIVDDDNIEEGTKEFKLSNDSSGMPDDSGLTIL